jgi:hypothetical protein
MKTYLAKLSVDIEVEAFNEADAMEYLSDIFNIDDEIKKVGIVKIIEKKR